MSAICSESHHSLHRRLGTVGTHGVRGEALVAPSVPLRASCCAQGLEPGGVALEVTRSHTEVGLPFMLDHLEGARWPQGCRRVRESSADSITTAHFLAPS